MAPRQPRDDGTAKAYISFAVGSVRKKPFDVRVTAHDAVEDHPVLRFERDPRGVADPESYSVGQLRLLEPVSGRIDTRGREVPASSPRHPRLRRLYRPPAETLPLDVCLPSPAEPLSEPLCQVTHVSHAGLDVSA
jgi:hypothetical protein